MQGMMYHTDRGTGAVPRFVCLFFILTLGLQQLGLFYVPLYGRWYVEIRRGAKLSTLSICGSKVLGEVTQLTTWKTCNFKIFPMFGRLEVLLS